MNVPLFEGSLIPTPKAYTHFCEAILAERAALFSAVREVLDDADASIPTAETRRALEAALDVSAAPVSDTPDALRAECAVLMRAAIAVAEDPTVCLTDRSIHDRLRACVDRTEALAFASPSPSV